MQTFSSHFVQNGRLPHRAPWPTSHHASGSPAPSARSQLHAEHPSPDLAPCTSTPSEATPAGRSHAATSLRHAWLDRRTCMTAIAAASLAPALTASWAGQARAAPLLPPFLSRLYSPPPEPVRFPRKALDQVFAVLLMRSSYDAVDDLDFIPMNDFQKNFWLFRQSEQESYNLQYSPLKPRLGDLTDPLYFDFISFAQYVVIDREMRRGQQVFNEFCDDCPDQRRVVRRDAALADNAQLPERFSALVGDKVYDGLLNGFRGQQFEAVPRPLGRAASVQDVATAVQALLDVLVDRGYALKAQVTLLDPAAAAAAAEQADNLATSPTAPADASASAATGPSFRVSVQGPATLWAQAALAYRGTAVRNAFDAAVIDAYLRASGLRGSHQDTISDVGVEQLWTLA